MNVGINPDYDFLFDRQQKPPNLFAVCDCCGHGILLGETFYRIGVQKDVMCICEDCYAEIAEEVAEIDDEL